MTLVKEFPSVSFMPVLHSSFSHNNATARKQVRRTIDTMCMFQLLPLYFVFNHYISMLFSMKSYLTSLNNSWKMSTESPKQDPSSNLRRPCQKDTKRQTTSHSSFSFLILSLLTKLIRALLVK